MLAQFAGRRPKFAVWRRLFNPNTDTTAGKLATGRQFEATVHSVAFAPRPPLDVLVEPAAIEVWAPHLNLTVDDIHGSDRFIPIAGRVVFENGASNGQSIAVLRKPLADGATGASARLLG